MDTTDTTNQQQQQQHATQADLVRALESIDHTISFDFLPTTVSHDHDQEHEATTSSDVAPSAAGVNGAGAGELDNWSREQLQAEILKLRRLASSSTSTITTIAIDPKLQNQDHHVDSSSNSDTAALAEALINASPPPPPPTHQILGYPTVPQVGEEGTKRKTNRKRKHVSTTSPGDNEAEHRDKSSQRQRQRREDTGKRFEKERRSELSKLVRNKMRAALNLGEKDPIPHSFNNLNNPLPLVERIDGDGDGDEPSQSPATLFVPDWYQALNDETNSAWVSKIVDEVIEDSSTGQFNKIPQEDFSPEIVTYTARTAFQNMCKKYVADNHPKGAERREKYTKKRRRWARKDLKQRKRAKSTLDPSFEISLPPAALHLDYMSSEYSSAGEGEDDEDSHLNVGRKEKWIDMISQTQTQSGEQTEVLGKGGWAVGLGEKVLEVRTPRWRSEQLNDIYRRLDAIAAEQADQRAHASSTAAAAAGNKLNQPSPSASASASSSSNKPPRAGHVAPSHRRFTLDPALMRKGRQPRDVGEDWMWASGAKGVWPQIPRAHIEIHEGQGVGIEMLHRENESEHGMDIGAVVEQGWEEFGEAERLGLVSALEGLP